MLLKDLMEDKQLNFNQPLLSVRRFSSTKASEKRKTDHNNSKNSSAKAPPLVSHKPELKSGPIKSTGNVPFVWEKAPGKPKDQSKSHTQSVEKPHNITPNYPPGRVSKQGSGSASKGEIVASLDERVIKSGSLKEKENNKEEASSDSDDETFLDALDTLSRAESFFMSSSVNSRSGLDDHEVQLSRSLSSSSDQPARDFIIDRFLPAAQAMISEMRQYGSFRRPIAGQEKQKQVKKAENAKKHRSQHRQKTLPHCGQDKTDDSNGAESNMATGCGLFPRLCLLNPMPGLRMEDKVQSSAVNGMQAKSIDSLIGTTKEHARTHSYRKKSLDSNAGFAEEKDIMCVSEKSKHSTDPRRRGCRKSLTGVSTQHADTSHESPVAEKTLYVDSVQKVKSHYSSSCPFEMKCQTSHKGSGIGKNPSNDESSLIGTANDEKVKSQHKNLVSPDMKMEISNHSKKPDSEKQGMKKPIIQGSKLNKDSVSSPKVAECKKITDLARQVHSLITSSGCQIQCPKSAKPVDKECTSGSTHDPCTLATTKIGDDGKIDLQSQILMKLGHQETSDTSYLQLPFILPSLKAPSESWLKRTLPTISSRNINPIPNLASITCATSQVHMTPSLNSKWETIVNSSNVHDHGYQKLPKELLTTIPEA